MLIGWRTRLEPEDQRGVAQRSWEEMGRPELGQEVWGERGRGGEAGS